VIAMLYLPYRSFVSGVVTVLAAMGASSSAHAQEAARPPSDKPDATYGRLDGDIGLVGGVGVAVGPRSPRAAVDLRLRYMETAGLFFTYEDGKAFGGSPEPVRVLAGGLELRPLFIARWLTGRELTLPRVDLLLDSFGIELGGFFAQPVGGTLGERPGFQAGLGLEVPILPKASGPWIGLHGGLRWSDGVLGGDAVQGPADRAAFLSITLAWHQIVGSHVVDVNDRAPR
jgi:hypothetical protein